MPYSGEFREKGRQGLVGGRRIRRTYENAPDGAAGVVLPHVVQKARTAEDGGVALAFLVPHDPHDEHFPDFFSLEEHVGAQIAALVGGDAVEGKVPGGAVQFGVHENIGNLPGAEFLDEHLGLVLENGGDDHAGRLALMHLGANFPE